MQAKEQQYPTEPFLQQRIAERPFALWIIWILGIFAWIFLILGLILDEVGYATYYLAVTATVQNNDLQTCTCGWSTFTCLGTGFQNVAYADTDSSSYLLQTQAGNTWLAFMIIGMIMTPLCCFGFFKDYLKGKYDSVTPIDYYDGCPLFGNCGFSSLGMILTMIPVLLALLLYVIQEQCSSENFWNVSQSGNVEQLTGFGGITMALTIVALIFFAVIQGLVFYSKRAFGEVPTGEQKANPIQFTTQAVGAPPPKPKPEPKPIYKPTGEAPKSNMFQPTNVIAAPNQSGTSPNRIPVASSSSSPGMSPKNSRPNMPPPVPAKPKGPPPKP